MGKKGTKRKTQWRTLSVTECPQEPLENNKSVGKFTTKNTINSTTDPNIDEAISLDDDYKNKYSTSNSLYLKRKSSTLSSPPNNYKNDYRNRSSQNNNSYNNKQNSTSSTSSLYSSRFSYRRRPYSLQNGSSKYYSSYGAERATSRGHRTTSEPRDENDTTKPLFNEDDYTRITTPRQDVIFKKGYFSQPKKYLSSTDTNTTSSATASVVSVEESMSATSVPSLSPEQCSSQADSLDPDQGFLYSFIDPNGVVYSYVPNGFDQYNGQMMVLPYGYPPYNICSSETNSPTGSTEDCDQNRTSVDSNEILDDLIENNVESEEPVVPQDAKEAEIEADKDNKESDDLNESEDSRAEDGSKDNDENSETPPNVAGQYYNYGYQPCYPHVVYPYLFPHQFVPVFGNEYDASNEMCDEDLESQDRVRYRCRKRDKKDGNSTGVSATTTDYSEDEYSEAEDSSETRENNAINGDQTNDPTEDASTQNNETERTQVTLNTDVKEFIPKAGIKSSLNVNVKEFLPRNYHSQDQIEKPQDSDSKSPSTTHTSPETRTPNEVKIEQPVLVKKVLQKKPNELTLAEKIKLRLAEELKSATQKPVSVQKTTNQRRSSDKISSRKIEVSPDRPRNTKKKPKKVELPRPEIRTQPSYAQIANKNKIEAANEITSSSPPMKEVNTLESKVERTLEVPVQTVDTPAAQSTEMVAVDAWQTVKIRGKRTKHFKELVWDEEPIEEPRPQVKEEQTVGQSVELNESVEPNEEPSAEIEIPSNTDAALPDSSQKKKATKSRSRKTPKKSLASNKKTKRLELVEPIFELPKKTEIFNGDITHDRLLHIKSISPDMIEGVPNDIEDAIEVNEDDSLTPKLSTPTQSESDLTFDRLYLGKGFGRSPMDILKGFDYKYKSKSILREEEEMVLSVIKSLNSSGSEKKRIPQTVLSLDSDETNDEKTIVESCDNKNDAQDGGSDSDTVSELSTENETVIDIHAAKENHLESLACNGQDEDTEASSFINTEGGEPTEDEDLVKVSCNEVSSIFDEKDGKLETETICEENGKDFYEVPSIAAENGFEDSPALSNNDFEEFKENGVCNNIEQQDETVGNLTNGLDENHVTNEDKVELKEVVIADTAAILSQVNGFMNLEESLKSEVELEESLKSEVDLEDATVVLSHVNGFTNLEESSKSEVELEDTIEVLSQVKGLTDLEESSKSEVELEDKLSEETEESRPKLNNVELSFSILKDEVELNQDPPTEVEGKVDPAYTLSSQEGETQLDVEGTVQINSPSTHVPFTRYPSIQADLDLQSIRNDKNTLNNTDPSTDYTACVEILSNIVRLGSPSKGPEINAITEGWNLIMTREASVNSDEKTYSSEDNSDDAEDIICKLNGLKSDDIRNVKNRKEDEVVHGHHDSLTNGFDKCNGILNGIHTNGQDRVSERIENGIKDQSRTFNSLISCDQSSGIGSDCDASEFDHKADISDSLNTAQNNCSPSSASFPSTAHQTKPTASNMLPKDHQTNSVCCDTQTVSYTSKKTTGPKLSTSPSSNEAKGGVSLPDTNDPKFPSRSELVSNDDLFPLTAAVKQWLTEETKEPSPEPILRLPDNPDLKSLLNMQLQSADYDESWSMTDESDNENDTTPKTVTNPKNLKGNPLHVSSVNIVNDTDNGLTCERVAKILSDNTSIIPDLLDYWDDEFVRNPQKWLKSSPKSSHSTSTGHEKPTAEHEPFEPYESLYGNTINYNQLLASNFEFLSNNILSFNNDNNADKVINNNYKKTNYHKNDTSLNNNNNNFDIDIHRNTTTTNTTTHNTHTNNSDNCVKPPEVCCILI